MKRSSYFLVLTLLVLGSLLSCDGYFIETSHPEERESNPEKNEILFEGLLTDGKVESFPYLMPGIFLDAFDFANALEPLDSENPLKLSREWMDALRNIRPELRLIKIPQGVAILRRGWEQTKIVEADKCLLIFDFRADVRELSLGNNGPFGRIPGVQWNITVLNRQNHNTDGLYVLIVTQVQINKDRIGESFTEGHDELKRERQAQGKPVTIDSLPRWFVVEHELGHVDQVKEEFKKVVTDVVKRFNLCNTTRPTNRHKALIEQGFAIIWGNLTAEGAGGSHENSSNYPNNNIEKEVRERAWAEYDGRAGN